MLCIYTICVLLQMRLRTLHVVLSQSAVGPLSHMQGPHHLVLRTRETDSGLSTSDLWHSCIGGDGGGGGPARVTPNAEDAANTLFSLVC